MPPEAITTKQNGPLQGLPLGRMKCYSTSVLFHHPPWSPRRSPRCCCFSDQRTQVGFLQVQTVWWRANGEPLPWSYRYIKGQLGSWDFSSFPAFIEPDADKNKCQVYSSVDQRCCAGQYHAEFFSELKWTFCALKSKDKWTTRAFENLAHLKACIHFWVLNIVSRTHINMSLPDYELRFLCPPLGKFLWIFMHIFFLLNLWEKTLFWLTGPY